MSHRDSGKSQREMEANPDSAASSAQNSRGFATVLIAVYAIFALAATARASVQMLRDFERAPMAYSLSLLAAITYIAVTVLLITRGPLARSTVAVVLFEIVGVLTVGTMSVIAPQWFPDATVWSFYGIGYGFVPLVLPVIALVYMAIRQRRRCEPPHPLDSAESPGSAPHFAHRGPRDD